MNVLRPVVDSLQHPLPVYVLVGSDGLLARRAIDTIRGAVLVASTRAFNDAAFSAAEDKPGAVLDVLQTLPMMAPRRLVVLRQLEDANVAMLEMVLGYLGSPCPTTTLVLSGEKFPGAVGGVDRGVRITNAAKKVGLAVKLEASGVDLADFAGSLAAERGVRLGPGAARRLAELTGEELGVLASNLERCADFAGAGGTVTVDVVEQLCVDVVDAEVWALTDALVHRDADRALGTLHRLLDGGEPGHRILAMVAWQLRQILAVQDVVRRGLPEREAQVRLPPQKLRAVRELVSRRPVSPSAQLEELAATNKAMNSSRAGDRRVMEAWILRLVAA